MKTISILSIAFCCLFTIQINAQWLKTKTIDEGGSGPYHAIAVSEKSLSDFVIYRPKNIEEAVSTEDKLPILIWANGGCMDSSIHHERLLSEIASYGYIIVAIGDLQMTVEERTHKSTEDEKLLKGLDWITKKATTKGNDYYNNVDLNKIAAGGQSCGGAQVMRIAGNPAIKTYMMFNSGMGDMTMAGANTKSLQKLNGDVIYLVGGETDVATENAFLDYDRIENVPVAFGNNLEAGHGGTFDEKNGGSFAKMAKDWLDWHFKNEDKSDVFLESNLENYPGWTMKSKNFDK